MSCKKIIFFTCWLALLLTLMVPAIAPRFVTAAPLQAIPRYVIGAGGDSLTSGAYSLDYTIGQPVAGIASQALCSGYWCGLQAPPTTDSLEVYLPLVTR